MFEIESNFLRKFQTVVLLSLTAVLCLLSTCLAAAQTAVSATSVNFANVVINRTSGPRKVILKNTGAAPIGINSLAIAPGPPYLIDPSTTCPNPGSLSAGATCTLALAMTPVSIGAQPGGTLTITSTAPNSPLTISLAGNGIAPTVISPSAVQFYNVATGTASAIKWITLSSYEPVPLTISSLALSPGSAFAMDPSTTCPHPGQLPANPYELFAGSTCTIALKFNPTVTGAQTDTLTITTSADNSPQTVALAGTGILPTTISATAVNFGNVPTGEVSSIRTVGFRNNQTVALNITSLAVSGDAQFALDSSSTCPGSGPLAAGAVCTLALKFAPTSIGAQPAGTLTIASNAGNSPQTVALSGNGIAPTVISLPAVQFYNVAAGTASAIKTLTFYSYEPSPLTINSILLPAGSAFALDPSTTCPHPGQMPPNPLELFAGSTCTIAVTFNPTATGAQTDTLTIATSAGNSPLTVALAGTGIAPTSISATAINFGNVPVGSTAPIRTIAFRNNATVALNISSVAVSGDTQFALDPSTTCPSSGSLGAGASCTLGLTFTPTSTGAQPAGTLTITSNAGGSQNATLSGNGIAPTMISPSGVQFYNVATGTASAVKTVTFYSYEPTPLTISSLSLPAGSAFALDPSTTCPNPGQMPANPLELFSGSTCTIALTFNPTATGAQTDTLTIATGAGNSPQTVALAGTGIPPTVLSPTLVGFGSVVVNTTSAIKTLVLKNNQTGPLTISSIGFSGPFALNSGSVTTCPKAGGTVSGALAGLASCVIGVNFTPTATGPTSGGTITVFDSEPGGQISASLSGTGVLATSLSAATLAFGDVSVNTTSAAQSITLTNAQAVALQLSSITATGPYAVAPGTTTCRTTTPVAPQSSCTISVTFSPTSTGSAAGTLTIQDDAATGPTSLSASLTGAGVQPVSLSPAVLDFGTVAVSDPTVKSVTLTNNQGTALTINSITGFGGVYSLNAAGTSCPLTPNTLPAGGSCLIAVGLTATAAGPQPGTITITDNAPGGSQSFTLNANAVESAVLSPASLTFPAQLLGTTSAAQTVTLTNQQSVPLTITGVTITGANSGDFGVTSLCPTAPAAVPAGASCMFSVTFAPSVSGTRTATLNVADGIPGISQTVALTGAGNAPVTVLPSSIINFTAPVGASSAYKTITITNNLPNSINITGLQVSGDFQQTATNCGPTPSALPPYALASGASCNVTVSFAPTIGGTRGGQLQVYDEALTSPQVVNLSGTGTNPLTISSTWTLSPALTFSAQKVGTLSPPKNITLTNHESQSETFTLNAAGDFTASSNCATGVIAANSSCNISVVFAPGATATVGPDNGSLTITHSAAVGSPLVQALTGSASATNPPAAVAVIAPGAGAAGTTVNVVITGNGWTHFSSSSAISFVDTDSSANPSDITVQSFTAPSANEIDATLVLTGGSGVVYGARDISVVTPLTGGGNETAFLSSAFIIADPTNAHTIDTVIPNFGTQGQTLNVALTATGTHFIQDTTYVNFGDGVTLNSLTILSPTTAQANITISNTTYVGYRTITMVTGGEFATSSPTAFQIGPNNAALLSVNPSLEGQGWSGQINLIASGTHFLQDATQVSIPGGILVGNVQVTSLTTATAEVAVTAGAAVGLHDVTVSTGGEIATLGNSFTVLSTTPYLTSVAPSSGMQGQTLNVEILGGNTNFSSTAPASMLADFTGEITVNSITVNSPTDVISNITIHQNANVGSITAHLSSIDTGGNATIFPFTFTVMPSSASIISVVPNSVPQGGQVTLSVVGSNTHWDQSTTAAAFVPIPVGSIIVNEVQVADATHATLNITVSTDHPVVSHSFYMSTGGEVVWASVLVYANTPTLTMNPANGMPGTSFSVSFTGQFTSFTQAGTLPVISGEGVTLSGFTVSSSAGATATLTIAPTAPKTTRLVTFITGGEIVTTHFQVTNIPVGIIDVSPYHGPRNVTMDVAVTGLNTHFSTSSTVVLFGPQITVNNVIVTDATHLTANITASYVDPLSSVTYSTPPGWQSIYVNTGAEQVIGGFLVDPPASPKLVNVVPSSAAQGSTVDVTITGSLTHWVKGQTEAILGAGVTVANLTITSPTTATATLSVSPTAPVGGNSVIMLTGTEIVSGTGFSVTPNAAYIASVGPPVQNCNGEFVAYCSGSQSGVWVVSQLQTSTLSIVGVGTHWLQGETTVSFGPGVVVDQLTVTSPTTATVQITVLSNSPVGFAALTTTTDGEVVTLQQAIDIEQGYPTLLAFSPGGAEQGATLTLQVLGRFTNWQQGFTSLAFNQDITVNSINVIDSANLTANITVSPWAYVDWGTPCGHVLTVTSGNGQVSSNPIIGNFCVAQGAAQINSVSSLSGKQGTTQTVTITGGATHFLAGVTTVSFGDSNFQVGQAIVTSPTTLSVPVGVSTAATPGYKTVTVTTYGEVASQQYSFTVIPNVAILTEANPSQTEQGVQNLDVVLTGQYSHFSGASTATFGAGIVVNSVTYTSATQLTANISIDPLSFTGGRTVTVTTPGIDCTLLVTTVAPCPNGAPPGSTGSEIVTNNAFTILPGPAIITQVTPGTGNEGQEVVFTITGANTHWAQNFTQFYIPGAGYDLTVHAVIIDSPTSATVDMTVSPTANPGPRSVYMVTAGESLVDRGAFVVTGGVPVITYVSPNSANPGTNQLGVTIYGLYTKWDSTTTVNFGPGITVSSFQVEDSTHIGVVLDIDSAAQIGYRTVVVATGSQGLTGNFQVTAPAPPPTPYIWYYWPSSGLPGQTFTVSFTGMNTHWDPNPISGTQVTFGSGIQVNTFQVTSPTTALANITITATQAQTNLFVFTTGSEMESVGFNVVVDVPTLSIVDPGSGMQGAQNLTVNIFGQYTTFDNTTTFNFGPGITLNGTPTILGPTIASQSINIGQLAGLGGRSVTATTGAQVVSGAGFTVTPSLALIAAVTPNTAKQGDTIVVDVTGQNTHWDGSTVFQFGAGIVVTNTVINSSTDATLTLYLPALASIGATNASAQTQGEVAYIAHGFVVQAGTPLLLSSRPGSLPQQSSATFTIVSQATNWLPSAPPVVDMGAGVVLTNVLVTGPTTLTVDGYVQPTTNVGWRNLTVTSGAQVLGIAYAFYVSPGPAVINSLTPSSGGQNDNLPALQITGTNTHWQQGVTQLSFPGVLVNSFTVNSPTSITANITVSKYAAAGQVSVTATTLGEVATGTNVFTIIQTQPELLGAVVSPGTCVPVQTNCTTQQGESVTINLTGAFTHFTSASVPNFGAGIAVDSVTAFNPTQLQARITISPTTTIGPRDITVTTGAEAVTLSSGITVTIGPAAIQNLSPATGGQGNTYSVLVTGSQSHFASGVTTASFGGGIQVTGITVTDVLHATVAISIPNSTPLGQYNVSLTTGGEVATIPGGFTVTVGSPHLSVVSPPTGAQGSAHLSVALTGLFTNFVNGTSTASFGAGITVNSLTVSSATAAVADITIQPTAAVGSRTVTVSTNAETAIITGGFSVLPGIPMLLSATPGTAQAGGGANVVIDGQFTTFQQGFSTVSLGSGITVNFVTVNSTTQLTANINIAPNATVGGRDVSVTTNGHTLTLSSGFSVTPGTPVILQISPNIGNPGATVTVTLTGQYTNWVNGTTTASFGPNISVGGAAEGTSGPVTVNSATTLTAQLTIDAGASLGPQDVIVTTGAEVDTTPAGFTVQPTVIPAPSLISLSPGPNVGGMPINSSIIGVFSQPMDRTTINTSTVRFWLTSNPGGWVSLPGTVSVDATGRMMVFTPNSLLAVNSQFYLNLTGGIKDATGNAFNNYTVYLYSTGSANSAAPVVVATNPQPSTTAGTNVPIQIEFSTDMSQSTQTGLAVSTGGSPIAGSYSWNSNPYGSGGWGPGTLLTFTPSAPLVASSTYAVNYGAPLSDTAGNALTPGAFSFATSSGADTAQSYTGVNFSNYEGDLGTNFAPKATYSKPVNPIDINTGTLLLYNADSGKYIQGTVAVAADAMSATFTPTVPLLPNTLYHFHQSWGYYDADGNYLNGIDSYFYTGIGSDLVAPQVASVSPADGSTSVPLNTQVVVHFSSPIDPTATPAIQITPSGGSAIAGTASMASDQVTLTFTPAAPLQPSTQFTVEVSGYKDMVGNVGATFTSIFTAADSIAPLLVSTGLDASGTLIATSNTPDAHWVVVPNGSSTPQPLLVVAPGAAGWYGGWMANGPLSSWININPNSTSGNTYGVYSTTFNLPGSSVPANLCLTGAMGIDDNGLLLLNGQAITGNINSFGSLTTLNAPISAYLATGPNTLALQWGGTDNYMEAFRLQASIQTCGASYVGGLSIVSSTPASGSSNVATNTTITMDFNHPLDPATVNSSTLPVMIGWNSNQIIAGSYQVNGPQVIFTPDAPFPINTPIYVGNCNGPYDLAGETYPGCYGTQWLYFTTGGTAIAPPAPFQVMVFTPAANATNVGLRAPVYATFNRSFSPGTVNANDFALFAGGSQSPWCTGYSKSQDNATLQFNCAPLPSSSIMTAILNGGIQDWAGNGLTNFSSQFTTSQYDSNTNGTVITSRPGNASGGVSANQPIILFTNLPINSATATGGIQVAQNNVAIPGSAQVIDSGYALEFTPSSPFTAGALIQWWTTGSLLDTTYNTPINGASGYFYVAGDTSTAAPTVQAISPASGYSVAPNSWFDVQFNTPLDSNTIGDSTIYLYDSSTGLHVPVTYSMPQPNVVRLVPGSNLSAPNVWNYLYVNGGLHSSTSVPATSGYWSFYTNAPVDTTLPAIASAVPYNGATNVGVNVAPGVVFNKAIDPVSVNNNTFQVLNAGTPLVGSFWISSDDTRVEFVPNAPLPPSTNLTMSFNGVIDRVGNPITISSNFETAPGPDFTAPTIVWTSVSSYESIPVNSGITVQFSESMDVTTFSSGNFFIYDTLLNARVPASLTWSADQSVAYLVPTAPLAAGRLYYFYVYSGTDLAGNQVQGTLTYFYATFTGATSAPTVINFNPLSGATGLGTNATIEAQFSAPIDPNSVSGATLSTGGTTVAASPSLSAGNSVLQLVPQVPLAPNTTYVMTVAGVRDPAGNVVATVTNSFTTGPTYDIVAPSVVNYDPPNYATVGTNMVPKMVFNKPINPITVGNSTFRMYLNDINQWIPLGVTQSSDGLTVTMQPQIPLLPNRLYHYLACCGYQDQDGNNGNQADLYFYTGSGAVVTGPTVTVSPLNGASGIPLNAQVIVTVNGTMDPTNWGQSSIRLLDGSSNSVVGTVAWVNSSMLTFAPAGALSPNMTYTVNVSGFTDTNGNAVVPYTGTFTTGTAAASGGLSLVSTNIPWGTTVTDNMQPIILTFSQILDPTTVNSSTLKVMNSWNSNLGLAGTYSVNGPQVTFTPASPYPAGASIYVGECGGPTDILGEVFLKGGCYPQQLMYFVMATGSPDSTPLQVISVSPASGASNVGRDQSVSVTFNKSISPGSAGSYNTQLYAGQDLQTNGSVSWSADNRTMYFNIGALYNGTTYTIAVPAGGVTDMSGNALATNFISTFTTATDPATGNGSVVGTSPGANATGVPTNTLLTFYINRQVNAATLPGNVTVTVNGQVYAGTVLPAASGYEVQFTPAAPFPNSATIQWWFSGVSDVYGDAFNGASGTFYTAATVDPATATPTVVAVSPGSGTQNVPTNTQIDIQYSLPIDGSTLTSSNVYFNSGIPATISQPSPNVVRVIPDSPLNLNTWSYLCANSNVKGVNGVATPGNCWTTYFYPTAGPDTTPGTVSVGPPDGVIGVGTNAYIRLQFSKPVDRTTVNSSNVQITSAGIPIQGTWSYNYSGNDIYGANFYPMNPLPASSNIQVSINGLLDYAGNSFSSPTVQFTTAALPDYSTPSISLDFPWYVGGIATNASFTCRSSEAMDPSSVTSGGTYVYSYVTGARVPVTFTFSADLMSVTMTPTSALFANTQYYYSCQSAIDLTGNAENGSYVVFYTGSGASSAGPMLLQANPPNGFTNVALNTNNGQWAGTSLGLLFNEPVAVASLGGITLTPAGGSPIPIAVSPEWGNTIAVVQLPWALQPNTTYTYNLTGVTDYSGNPMAPTTSSFTTGSSYDWSNLAATAASPANGASGTDINAPVTLTFGEAINPVLTTSSQLYLRTHNTQATVPTTMTFSVDYKTVILTPTTPLIPSTIYDLVYWPNNWYLVNVAGIPDYNYGVESTFTTGTATAVNGACGAANGMSFPSPPAANLCSAGTASSLTNTGTWNWSCGGQFGGTDASCSAAVNLVQACYPQPSGLVSWWRGEGDATDHMGNNDGALENGASFGLGQVGDAFSMNGGNQYVLVGDPVAADLQIQNAITLSAWIYVTGYPVDNGSGALGLIVGSQHDSTTAGATIFYDGRTNPDGFSGVPPGHIHFQLGDGAWHQTNTLTQVPLNQWVLVTAARTANNDAQIYYNGVLQPSLGLPWTGNVSYSGAWFAIGQQKDLNRPFNGLIDEVQVYNTALTAAQIQGIYSAGMTGVCP